MNADQKKAEKKAKKDVEKLDAEIKMASDSEEFDEVLLSIMSNSNHKAAKEVMIQRQLYDTLSERLSKMTDEEQVDVETTDEKLEAQTQKIEELKQELDGIEYEKEEDDPVIDDWISKDMNSIEKLVRESVKERGMEEKELIWLRLHNVGRIALGKNNPLMWSVLELTIFPFKTPFTNR